MIPSRAAVYLFAAGLFLAACAEGQRVSVPVELGQAHTGQPQPLAALSSAPETDDDIDDGKDDGSDESIGTAIAALQPDEVVATPDNARAANIRAADALADNSAPSVIAKTDKQPKQTASEETEISSQTANTQLPASPDNTTVTEMASLVEAPEAPTLPLPTLPLIGEEPKAPDPAPPPPPLQLQPASLVGLTGQSLESEIGAADFIRTEGKMQVWQYKLASCVTDFFLYPADGQDTVSVFLVTDWFSRSSEFGTLLNARKCREDLATRQRF